MENIYANLYLLQKKLKKHEDFEIEYKNLEKANNELKIQYKSLKEEHEGLKVDFDRFKKWYNLFFVGHFI
jgi:predicted RNase H-like nuclease (RuvC/YqgF family)